VTRSTTAKTPVEGMDDVENTPTFEPSLPSDVYSSLEKALIWAALGAIVVACASLVLAFDTVWTDTLKPIVWDPVVKDAGSAGDAGYTPQNTAIYTGSMLACVVVLQALFRKWNLPADDRMTLALIAWVCVAPVMRVLEDADFFSSETDVLFISPIIHLHLAAWLIGVAVLGHLTGRKWDQSHSDRAENAQRTMLFAIMGLGIILQWWWLYAPAYAEHPDASFFYGRLAMVLGVATVWLTLVQTRKWPSITRSMLSFALGAVVLGVGHWVQFMATPWAQESGRVSGDITVWPAFLVLGLPAVVCFVMYRYGRDDARQLALTGHLPGVLPTGISLKQWEAEPDAWKDHPVEFLSNKALLAHPMVLGMVYGQLCDGIATMVGIDLFGYGEKHPVSNQVIVYGGQLNEMLGVDFGEGAWLFALVKALLVGLIAYLFVQMRVEERQQHFRVLIVLAVLIVGLAPGLRDIGRLMLGV